MSPAEFVVVAENPRLILPLGAWALAEACRQLAEWQAAGVAPAGFTVSPVQVLTLLFPTWALRSGSRATLTVSPQRARRPAPWVKTGFH